MGNINHNSPASSTTDFPSMGAMGTFFNFNTTNFYILFQFWYVSSVELFVASLFIVGFLSFLNEIFTIHILELTKLVPDYEHILYPTLMFIKMFVNGILMLVMMTFNGILSII